MQGPTYPSGTSGTSCVAYNGYIYCLGGYGSCTAEGCYATSSAYFASILPNGSLGDWAATTSYPMPVGEPTCAAYSGYIYCIGGNIVANQTLTAFAPISSTGIGRWNLTTRYPAPVFYTNCALYEASIYCMGGVGGGLYGGPYLGTYFAPLSRSGIGQWVAGSRYATNAAFPGDLRLSSCITLNKTIYCFGGLGEEPSSYYLYSPISASGQPGHWIGGSFDIPVFIYGESCALVQNYIYCVGAGTVIYAPESSLASNGAWSYGPSLDGGSCTSYSGFLYCLGMPPSDNATELANHYPMYFMHAGSPATPSLSGAPPGGFSTPFFVSFILPLAIVVVVAIAIVALLRLRGGKPKEGTVGPASTPAALTPPRAGMTCGSCGRINRVGALYCSKCGTKLA